MHHFETVLALLVGVTFLALVARRLAIPTPAVLLAGGVLVALLPGLPMVQFEPPALMNGLKRRPSKKSVAPAPV